jgi:hypothetical protein
MHAVRRLEALTTQAARRARLLKLLVERRSLPLSPEDGRTVAYVCIEAPNLWAQFSRSYYLSTALRARDATGQRITHGLAHIRSHDDALTEAVYLKRPKLQKQGRLPPWTWVEEPRWHEPRVLLDVVSHLMPSNLSKLNVALAVQTTFFTDSIAFRNFFAHRSKSTVELARALATGYGLSPRLRPADLLSSRAKGRPQSVLADWLDDLAAVIELTV